MKRGSSFILACFIGFVGLLVASVLVAHAAPAKGKAEVTGRKIAFDTGKKDAKGKAVVREFPTMFDIALRSKDHKANKQKKGKGGK